jgi:8-oxo-dGTP pyrophosphatase MutT (NUDIX family)
MAQAQEEIVQLVDEDNNETGSCPRSEMRTKGLIHRACYILVFNDRDELFLQKRTAWKDIYPGYWDVAAGGVVLAGEPYELSAIRELGEELGVHDVPIQFHFDYYYQASDNKVWGRIFSCHHNGPFVLQESEVAGGRFISIDDAIELSKSEPFTPDGVEILRLFQQGQQK